jgi:hypothetical protein
MIIVLHGIIVFCVIIFRVIISRVIIVRFGIVCGIAIDSCRRFDLSRIIRALHHLPLPRDSVVYNHHTTFIISVSGRKVTGFTDRTCTTRGFDTICTSFQREQSGLRR